MKQCTPAETYRNQIRGLQRTFSVVRKGASADT